MPTPKAAKKTTAKKSAAKRAAPKVVADQDVDVPGDVALTQLQEPVSGNSAHSA